MVVGPVLLLDLDAGSFTTFCGNLAVRVAHDLTVKLTDPLREPIECTKGQNRAARCVQLGPQVGTSPYPTDYLILGFESARLSGAVVGSRRDNIRLVDEIDSRSAAAACP